MVFCSFLRKCLPLRLSVSFSRSHKFLYSFLILSTLLVLCYYLNLWCLGSIPFFQALLSKAGLSLGGRALSLVLCKGLGCSGGLALAIGFAARALFASEAPADLLHFLNEDGAAASSSSRGEESIVRAPSPGGPVEIFDVPETPPQGTSVNPPMAGEGPPHQIEILRNVSFESSLQNRVKRLENEETLFLLYKNKGEYWTEIKNSLDQAPSQQEYYRILEFENRDLQIREQKHLLYTIFRQMLSAHPAFVEKAAYNPQKTFIDFFDEKREELDNKLEWSPAQRDKRELSFLYTVRKDLRERGPDSLYFYRFLGR